MEDVRVDKIRAALDKLPAEVEEVSFEYVMASFFPKAYKNMNDLLHQAHLDGYKQGMKDAEANK